MVLTHCQNSKHRNGYASKFSPLASKGLVASWATSSRPGQRGVEGLVTGKIGELSVSYGTYM